MTEHLLEKLFAKIKKERENSSPIARIDCNPKFHAELLNFIMHRGIRPKVSKTARKSLDTILIVKVLSQKAPFKILRSKDSGGGVILDGYPLGSHVDPTPFILCPISDAYVSIEHCQACKHFQSLESPDADVTSGNVKVLCDFSKGGTS